MVQVISVLTSLILLPSMQMFIGRICFALCCVPTIKYVHEFYHNLFPIHFFTPKLYIIAILL